METEMKKVIRNGKVAVLVSSGVGAGWYSWNSAHKEILFHPKVVEMVEQGRNNKIDDEWVKENLWIDNIYCGGVGGLTIHWLPAGTSFSIEEYDWAEVLMTSESLNQIA